MVHDAPIPDAIPFRTLGRISGTALGVIALLVAVGVVAALYEVLTGHSVRVWEALLFNWLFWSSVAIGMVIFAVALHLTSADWAWSVRRYALGGVAFLPISFLLLFLLIPGSEHYFHEWLPVVRGEVHDPIVEAKSAWLNLPFLWARVILGTAVVFGLAIAFAYYQVRPDVYGCGNDRQCRWYERLGMARNWRGMEVEAARSQHLATVLAVVLALAFAVFWGLVGIDLAMTLEPHYFSTMYPVAFFITAFHGGIAATAIATTLVRRQLGLQDFITVRQYHDLGKLVFAFSVFWMYIQWSQYIVIWYSLLPHPQEWFVHRFIGPFGPIVQMAVVLVFLLPFFGLLMRPPKQVPAIVAFFAGLILIGHWLERFLLVVPSLWIGEYYPIGVAEIGIGLGFLGLFIGAYMWFVSTFPVLPSPAVLAVQGSAVVATPETATEP